MSDSVNSLVLYSTKNAAIAVLNKEHETIISQKWNQTTKQKGKEVFVVVPKSLLSPADDLPESYSAFVQAVIQMQAENSLKAWVNKNQNASAIPMQALSQDQLMLDFIEARSTKWVNKAELEEWFKQSETWKRIANKPEFQNNAQFKKMAMKFWDKIIAISAKPTVYEPEDAEKYLAKFQDVDLESSEGQFIANRLGKMIQKEEEEDDGDMDLDAL